MLSPDLRARREAVVREHLESENAHDFDSTIATFGHPRYELVATNVYDGEEAVRGCFAESRRAFRCRTARIFRLRGRPSGLRAGSTSTSSRSCASSGSHTTPSRSRGD